jgi:hypothetical protein
LSLAFTALMRPIDAVWLAAPLLAAALLVRRWRRPMLLVAMVTGLGMGSAEWVAEAYVRFGGLTERLHASSRIQGGMGLHLAIDDELRALNGPELCRPCTRPWRHRPASAWWFALPFLTLGGLLVARRTDRMAHALLPTLCAVTASVPYLVLIDYAAPRFLLPVYALLSIPVAICLAWLVTGVPRRLRPYTATLVTLGMLGHLLIQQLVLNRQVHGVMISHGDYVRMAADLRRLGVRPPCLLTGDQATPIAFYARCSWAQTRGNNTSTTPAHMVALARRQPVVVLLGPGDRPPRYARTWRPYPLPGGRHFDGFRAYLPPSWAPR